MRIKKDFIVELRVSWQKQPYRNRGSTDFSPGKFKFHDQEYSNRGMGSNDRKGKVVQQLKEMMTESTSCSQRLVTCQGTKKDQVWSEGIVACFI